MRNGNDVGLYYLNDRARIAEAKGGPECVNERLAHWILNWVKQHPEVRHQRWLGHKMIREALDAFPEVQPVELQHALFRAMELRRAELHNQ